MDDISFLQGTSISMLLDWCVGELKQATYTSRGSEEEVEIRAA